MIINVTESDFIDAFQRVRPENFTIPGLRALFEWLDEYDESTGEQTELDVIAICVDFSEYANLEEFQQDYGADEYPDHESIMDATHFISIDDAAFIVGSF